MRHTYRLITFIFSRLSLSDTGPPWRRQARRLFEARWRDSQARRPVRAHFPPSQCFFPCIYVSAMFVCFVRTRRDRSLTGMGGISHVHCARFSWMRTACSFLPFFALHRRVFSRILSSAQTHFTHILILPLRPCSRRPRPPHARLFTIVASTSPLSIHAHQNSHVGTTRNKKMKNRQPFCRVSQVRAEPTEQGPDAATQDFSAHVRSGMLSQIFSLLSPNRIRFCQPLISVVCSDRIRFPLISDLCGHGFLRLARFGK